MSEQEQEQRQEQMQDQTNTDGSASSPSPPSHPDATYVPPSPAPAAYSSPQINLSRAMPMTNSGMGSTLSATSDHESRLAMSVEALRLQREKRNLLLTTMRQKAALESAIQERSTELADIEQRKWSIEQERLAGLTQFEAERSMALQGIEKTEAERVKAQKRAQELSQQREEQEKSLAALADAKRELLIERDRLESSLKELNLSLQSSQHGVALNQDQVNSMRKAMEQSRSMAAEIHGEVDTAKSQISSVIQRLSGAMEESQPGSFSRSSVFMPLPPPDPEVQEILTADNNIRSLQSRRSKVESALSQTQDEINQLEVGNSQEQKDRIQTINELRSEVDDLRQKKDQLLDKLHKQEEEKARLEMRLKQEQSRSLSSARTIDQQRARAIMDQSERLTELDAQYEANIEEINSLEAQLANANKKARRAAAKLGRSVSTQSLDGIPLSDSSESSGSFDDSSSEKSDEGRRESIKDVNAQILEHAGQIERCKEAIQNEKKIREERRKAHERRMQALRQRENDAKTKAAIYEDMLQSSRQQLDQLRQSGAQTDSLAAQDVAILTKQIQTAQNTLDRMREQAQSEQEDALRTTERLKKDREEQREQLLAKAESVSADLSQAMAESNAMTQEIEKAKSRVEEQRKIKGALEITVDELQKASADLERDRSRLTESLARELSKEQKALQDLELKLNSMRRQKKNAVGELAGIDEEIVAVRAQRDRCAADVDDVKRALDILEKKTSTQLSLCKMKADSVKSELSIRSSELRDSVSAAQDSVHTLQSQIALLEGQIRSVQDTTEKARDRIEELDNVISRTNRNAELDKEHMQKTLDGLQSRLNELKKAQEEGDANFEKEREEKTTEVREKSEELSRITSDAANERSQGTKKLADLEKEIGRVTKAIARSREEMEAHYQDRATSVTACGLKKTNAEKAAKSRDSDVRKTQRELDAMKKTFEQLSAEVEKEQSVFDEAMNRLIEERDKIQGEMKIVEEAVEDRTSQLTQYEGHIEALSSSIRQLQEERDSLAVQYNDREATLANSISAIQARVFEAQRSAQTYEQYRDELIEEAKSLRSGIEDMQSMVQEARSSMVSRQSEEGTMMAQQDMSATVPMDGRETAVFSRDVGRLDRDPDGLIVDTTIYESEIPHPWLDRKKEMEELDRRILEVDEEIETLNAQIVELQHQIVEEKQQKNQEIEELRDSIDKIQAQITELQAQKAEKETTKEELKMSLISVEDNITKIQSIQKNLLSECSEQEEAAQAISKDIEALKKQIQISSLDCQQLELLQESLQAEVNKLRDLIASVQEDAQTSESKCKEKDEQLAEIVESYKEEMERMNKLFIAAQNTSQDIAGQQRVRMENIMESLKNHDSALQAMQSKVDNLNSVVTAIIRDCAAHGTERSQDILKQVTRRFGQFVTELCLTIKNEAQSNTARVERMNGLLTRYRNIGVRLWSGIEAARASIAQGWKERQTILDQQQKVIEDMSAVLGENRNLLSELDAESIFATKNITEFRQRLSLVLGKELDTDPTLHDQEIESLLAAIQRRTQDIADMRRVLPSAPLRARMAVFFPNAPLSGASASIASTASKAAATKSSVQSPALSGIDGIGTSKRTGHK